MERYTFKQAREDYPVFFKNTVNVEWRGGKAYSKIVSSLYKNRCFIAKHKNTFGDILFIVWYVPPIPSDTSVRIVDTRGHSTLKEARVVARRGFDPKSKHIF